MVDYAEEIAKRIADRRARRRYWPEGEPGTDVGIHRDRGHGKRRGKSDSSEEKDPSEEKWSTDPSFKKKRKTEEPEKLESISEFVKKERARRFERALKAMEERRVVPKEVPLKKWLSQPGNLDRALKRGMVKMIAKHPNPKSKDTEDVVTVGGRRYAKTDLYKTPLREKASEVVLKTKYGSEMWWDRNKKAVFVAAVSLVAGFMVYTAWKNAQLEKGLAKQRARRYGFAAHPSAQHTGLLAMPAHHWNRPSGGGMAHGGGGALGHHGGGGARQVFHGQGAGGAMQAFHGQGGGALSARHGFGREGSGRWGGYGGYGDYGGYGGYGDYGGYGGYGDYGWGDWNPWYLDDATWWDDSFDPDAFWW